METTWSSQEMEYLIANYQTIRPKILKDYLNKTYAQVRYKAKKLGLIPPIFKPQIKWTKENIDLLKSEYPLGNKKELCDKLKINYFTLKNAAKRFNILSLQDKNLYKLKKLYEDKPLSYYWMGFIMADGSLNSKTGLKIALSAKDLTHLQSLANLLNINIHNYTYKTNYSSQPKQYCRISCNDATYNKLIMDKFGLTDLPKTYNPPVLPLMSAELFLSFFIGLIDGDGTFSKDYKGDCVFIRLEMHSSWHNNLIEISKRLELIGISGVKIGFTKRGYVFLRIYRKANFRILKQFIIKNTLPVLSRKWDCITLPNV